MIDHLVELKHISKMLRLMGAVNSLELGNHEAIDNKLSYSEFLLLLLQDEVNRHENNQFQLILNQSDFRNDKILEIFGFSFNPKINRQCIYDLATGRFVEEKAPILIASPTGTGKSHITQGIGHCMLKQGLTARMLTQTKLQTI